MKICPSYLMLYNLDRILLLDNERTKQYCHLITTHTLSDSFDLTVSIPVNRLSK
jgi:hypothetical protein